MLQGTEALNQWQRKTERYCVSLKKVNIAIYAGKVAERVRLA